MNTTWKRVLNSGWKATALFFLCVSRGVWCQPDPLMVDVEKAVDRARSPEMMLSTAVHAPWQIVHGLVGLGEELIIWDQAQKLRIRGVDWLTLRASWDQPVLQISPHGIHGREHSGRDYEGHPTQFLGYLSLLNLPPKTPINVKDPESGQWKGFTLQDWLRDTRSEVSEDAELTWTLWALSTYYPPDFKWQNKYGENWSIERILDIELNQPVETASCGGLHRLDAMTNALDRFRRTKKPCYGVWARAAEREKKYIAIAKSFQNLGPGKDGSFSSDYFDGPGWNPDVQRRLPGNGHILEWLLFALPQAELNEDWLRQGIRSVAQDLLQFQIAGPTVNFEAPGAYFHAVHAMRIYRDRMLSAAVSQ